jgi:hypothetical protein
MFACGCSESHSIPARDYAYRVLFEAKEQSAEKLHWREEQAIFMNAAHEYDSKHPGKIS